MELEGSTIAVLCHIVSHCSRQDEERWPAVVTSFFDVNSTSSDNSQQMKDVDEAAGLGQDVMWDW